MKRIVFISLLIYVLCSCAKDDKFDLEQFPQKWQLVKMSGQFSGSETYGDGMEWQEFYLLKSDNTFTKHRERDGVVAEASGTFAIKTLTDGKYLELTYESENDLIGSCLSNLSESLWVKSETKVVGTWLACDGPGLEYKRIE